MYDVDLDGPIRDLTARVLRPRPIRSDVAQVYRDARDAWEVQCEATAIGYASEIRDFRRATPAPRFADFTKGFAR